MAATEYSIDQEIQNLFDQTTATRSACDTFAREQLGGDIVPVTIQGVCSYTVIAGPKGEFIAQFRLECFQLNIDIMKLAETIYGNLVPKVTYRGQIGEDTTATATETKRPLHIYIMSRIQGISYLDFILAHNGQFSENSPEFFAWRRNFVADVARFFARSWKAPQENTVDETYKQTLHQSYKKDLDLLLTSLPPRFTPIIQSTLTAFPSIPSIPSLPLVLVHKDFGACNILVTETTCNLVGVVDWAEAEIAPFGINLYSHQRLISKVDFRTGWVRFDDYAECEDVFWGTFREEVGGGGDEVIGAIMAARVLGALLDCGFTSRLGNVSEPVPIREDDEVGRYNVRDLDGLLVNTGTRFLGLV
ncbi:hypothetical protein BO94DRAFT_592531 [Aspergillus sclerotioniger CBS 115572]|uniref:Aminoglycoside phosphotransferase domain-containing protein n=1 Tax=Aspergillus sclerotioniger CBS 115572 TaxID=1450535 RepID=A0A317XDD9_9EURO|nr:hypothetical protein BO94DRAFT_592531 [Aspergillus sclerotioniger CBS 115572]PWY96636.1 hypothetical protein BO94DRAFT_592531 [Aspergillus sclerotioniger CBS 115572]